MKRYLFATLLLTLALPFSLLAGEPFKGTFSSKELGLKMVIDLYAESVEVPGMEMFGPLNGYINGTGLYRTWYVSTIKQADKDKAIVHFSNDLGSETQTVELTMQGDSLLHFRAVGSCVMKKAVGKKLVKIQTEFDMQRQ